MIIPSFKKIMYGSLRPLITATIVTAGWATNIAYAGVCEYLIVTEWNKGFVANIRITNDTNTPIDGWTVGWRYNGDNLRASGWNADVTGNNPYTASNLSWNGNILPGNSAEFGLLGTKSLNGVAEKPRITGDVCRPVIVMPTPTPTVGTINGSPETGCTNPWTELSGAFLDFVEAPNVDVVLAEGGCTVSLESNGKPDHTSPYWDPNGTSGLWVEAEDPDVFGNPDRENHTGAASPGFVDEYVNNFNLLVSIAPQLATDLEATHLGAIGIATSGTPIFNRQEGPVDLGGGVIRGLDSNGAHTGPSTYHYHLEPKAVSFDDEELVGIMADGFFLYGRRDYLTLDYPSDLDEHNGHTGLTQHSNGVEVYHYHITNEPYIDGSEYYLVFGAFDFAGFESPVNNN